MDIERDPYEFTIYGTRNKVEVCLVGIVFDLWFHDYCHIASFGVV